MNYPWCIALLAALALSVNADGAERPNILFIMSDDHTTQAIGAYGSRLASLNPTPNIDALATRGMRFDRVFCNNSICTPSRASILTGQYSQSNGVLDLTGNLPVDKQYLPVAMGDAGYETAMIGKWHLKQEPAAFDYYCVLPNQGAYFDPVFRVRGELPWTRNKITTKGHSSDVITDVSLEWLRNGRDKSRPFFLMHHFKAPHDMFHNAKRYDDYLDDVTIPEPDNLHGQPAAGFGSAATRAYGAGVTKNHPSWGLGKRLGVDQSLEKPVYGQTVYQKFLKRYLRCVKGVDDNVGRLVEYLQQSGELENTIVIYTGDQGFLLGEHDFTDKRWMYDESMRMPFIVCCPKTVTPGSSNGWLINNTDFAPTMLALAGAEIPAAMQGRSFVAALKGQPKPNDWRTSTYYRYWMHLAHSLQVPGHFGIRSERYKLIFFYGCRPDGSEQTPVAWEFYDLQKDPFEMHNLYGVAQYKSIVDAMKVELRQTRKNLNETDAQYPQIQAIIDQHW
ncbi:MAG: sulfatase [Fuerstiella sp.]|nr:sulfatase [Fuerstiella sp.]MCP4855263.1 sulfatase [Fuerstiella sp.]